MAFELISTVTLTSAASSIEFTAIPQDGVDLLLVVSARSSSVADLTADLLSVRFNTNTSSIYTTQRLLGSGQGSPSADDLTNFSSAVRPFHTSGSTSTANTFGSISMILSNYAGAANKSFSVDAVAENNAASATQAISAGLFASTAAISSIEMTMISGGNFVSGSTASLYKIF